MTAPAEATSGEQRVFRALNRVVEPLVRAGVGTSLAGPGAFVVETTGRRSGQPRRVPLLGKRVGDTVIVSTVRDGSQWVRNLEHDPAAIVWIAGRPRPATASVARVPGGAVARLRLERGCLGGQRYRGGDGRRPVPRRPAAAAPANGGDARARRRDRAPHQ
jgi:deazaflavin-dependent oxidoreductase (nitroreductase family)